MLENGRSTLRTLPDIVFSCLPGGRVGRLWEDVKVGKGRVLILRFTRVAPHVGLGTSTNMTLGILLDLVKVGRFLAIASNRVVGVEVLQGQGAKQKRSL